MAESPKSSRILEIYQLFLSGKTINKKELAEKYQANPRSIQRDIESIRDFLSEQSTQKGVLQTIEYDGAARGFKLVKQDVSSLTNGEMLAVCKILIESRAFKKDELDSLLNRLLNLCVSPKEKSQIEWFFANEIYNYANPAHPPVDLDLLWQLAEAIRQQFVIEIKYHKIKDSETVIRLVEPVGLLFSEYYFYLMAFIEDDELKDNFEVPDDKNPTIYRLDRLDGVNVLNKHFRVAYQERFEEGVYKNISQYMKGGLVENIKFECGNSALEATLDRFPTAKIVSEGESGKTLSTTAFVRGFNTWALSQGKNIKVLEPEWVKDAITQEVKDILDLYK